MSINALGVASSNSLQQVNQDSTSKAYDFKRPTDCSSSGSFRGYDQLYLQQANSSVSEPDRPADVSVTTE